MAPMSRARTLALANGAPDAPERCIERGRRLVQVKFLALPMDPAPVAVPAAAEPAPSALRILFTRVLGLLAVARR